MSAAGKSVRFNMLYVWTISLVAALGGLMFGYDWVVISGAKPFYERFLDLQTAWQEGWAMSSALVGCLLGAIISGSLSDRLGRKKLLLFSAIVFVVSSVGTGMVHSFWAFNAWRIAGGIAIGLASNLSPMYIAEIAPAAVRGRLVAMNQFTIVVGILLAQGLNFGIARFGQQVDAQAPAAATLDARPVAEELAWQVPREKRPAMIADFVAAAKTRGGLPSVDAVNGLVQELPSARDEKGNPIKADDAVTLAAVGSGKTLWNVSDGWRWMFALTAIPALLFFALLFFVPESPRWLVKNGQSAAAQAVLARIGGEEYGRTEVADIESTLVGDIERVRFADLFEPKMLWILALGVALAVLQQWCGINVIFYYAADIFRDAGYRVSDALLNIVIVGAVNLAFTIIAVNSVDRFGRRVLMLLGFAGLTVIHSLIGLCFHQAYTGTYVLLLTLAAIACYALSLAPVVWVVLSEIFPNRIRGAAMSISVFSLWTACFILTESFPFLKDHLGSAKTFWLYAAICAGGFLFTLAKLPETKGKTLEQIERELVD